MEPLEGKLGLLIEDLGNVDGVMRHDQFQLDSSVLYSVTDVENTINEVLPVALHHPSERHGLRRCLRHLNRCLTQLHEKMMSSETENNQQQSLVAQCSDKLKQSLVILVTKLKLPLDDDYALELADTLLHLSTDLFVATNILNHSPALFCTILRRVLLYGEENQVRWRNTDVSKHSICLPWLYILTQQWGHVNPHSLSENESSQYIASDEHSLFQHYTESPIQCALDLQSAINTVALVFMSDKLQTGVRNEINLISETTLLWHNLIILLIRQLFQLIESKMICCEQPVSFQESLSFMVSSTEQEKISHGQKHQIQLFQLQNDLDNYLQDLVELTLDTIDTAMSINDDRFHPTSDNLDTSTQTSGFSKNCQSSSIGKRIDTAVKLAVITSDAIEVLQTASYLKLRCLSKLPGKLWKGLATAFVNEADLSCCAQLEVSFCASVLSAAEATLALQNESIPTSIIVVTFLRSIKFPDLLLESEGLWEEIKNRIKETDCLNLKHGVQAAALSIQQSLFCMTSTPGEDTDSCNTMLEQNNKLRSVIKRVIEILPSTSVGVPKTEASDGRNQSTDPWDEFFWCNMMNLGVHTSYEG